jgi:malate dehydrogenase (quinone)
LKPRIVSPALNKKASKVRLKSDEEKDGRTSSQAVGSNNTRTNTRHEQETDVLLIGGGIMSATLGTWLQELEPDWSITMVEQMSSVAEESSNGWNNAGTGHAALMELNYTPQTANGINIDKAVDINESFQISRQFWAHQVTAAF